MLYSPLLSCLLMSALLAAAAAAQENAAKPSPQADAGGPTADNPFRAWRLAVEQQSLKPQPSMQDGPGNGAYMGGYASGLGVMPGGPGGGYGGAAGGYGGGMSSEPSPSDLFQTAVRNSVQRLARAKTDAEKQKLLETVRSAFHERYQQAIAQRQGELDRLEQQLQQLRQDLERRRAAEQKIVEVQLRTVELAGEGLVELSSQQ